MEDEENVSIRFVLPQGKNETTCSEDLSYAYDQALDAGLHPIWIQHDEVLDLNLTKMDVFVMDPFDGDVFQSVSQSKSTLVGPRCLLSCLLKKEPVPELPYPMFTAAMKGFIVTSTGFEKEDKAQIQKLIERMSGIYSNAFHDGVTHLVAAVVRSSKYSVAVEKGIPIMTSEWVHQVWSKSQNEHVSAGDRQFARYACPALMGLSITVSNMSTKDKDLLKKSIESHGGTYSKILDMHSTNVLIISAPEGDKFTYAKKWKIPILNSNWIFDSIEKGYCLETENYKVEGRSCSTPTKDGVSRLTEVSLCSTIMAPGGDETTTVKVDETVENAGSVTSMERNEGRSIDSWLQSLDLNRVAKAGSFLEGCRIYLSGFNDVQQDHLRRVIQSAGATRMHQLAPSVTHIILKQHTKTKQLKELNISPFQVTIQWIVESMHLGCMAPESDFIPQRAITTLPPIFPKEETDEVTRLFNEGSETNTDLGRIASSSNSENEETLNGDRSESTKFLTDKKLALVGLDEETEQELSEWVDEEGGEIVSGNFKGILDYLVLPVHGCDMHTFKAKNKVNHLWLSECFDKDELVNIDYFFKPYSIDLKVKPLAGVVIGISGFTDGERQFLCSLTKALGGISQETFSQKDKGDTKKSTHLVSLTPEGRKYEAALRWKLPVVSKDWILSCTFKMKWISEKPFLMGESDIFTPEKPLPRNVKDIIVEDDKSEADTENEQSFEVMINNGINRNNISSNDFKTPVKSRTSKISDDFELETPSLDIEKIRPKKIELSPSLSIKWNPPPDSQPSPSSFKPSESCGQCLSDDDKPDEFHCRKFDTPHKPYGAFLGEENPNSHTRKFWKYQYDKVISSRPSESDRIKILEEIEELEHNQTKRRKDNTAKNLYLTNSLKDLTDSLRLKYQNQFTVVPFEDVMEEKMNRIGKSWKHVGKRVKLIRDGSPLKENTIYKLPLEGVIVYVTKKCNFLIDRISDSVYKLGGSITSTYVNDNVTHVVFSSSKANDITKEFRLARSDGKYIVSPDWIFECENEKKLLDPLAYPHTLNAKNLTNATMNETLNSVVMSSKKKKMDVRIIEDKLQDLTNMNTENNVRNKTSLTKTKLLANDDNSDGESIAFDDIVIESHELLNEGLKQMKYPEEVSTKNLTEDCELTANNSEFQSMEVPENMTEAALLENEVNGENLQRYRFMISGYPDEIKHEFGQLIESLKNNQFSLSDVNGCDPEATHIIAHKFSRSEKMLCAIASGKMFLHSSYIDECMAQKKIISPSEQYEWGHPDNSFLSKLDETGFEKQLAMASYRWRLKISKSKKGVFHGIVAIIHTTPKRREAFQRLIEFGGGRVITPDPPYIEPENATHCLAEPLKLPKTKIEYEALASRGIAVVEPIFINEFLINDPPPSVENYLIEEFKPVWFKNNTDN